MKIVIFMMIISLCQLKSSKSDPFNKKFYRNLNVKKSDYSIHDKVMDNYM